MGEYNELYHHGVKGQKWGVRHDRRYAGTRAHNVYKEARRHEHKVTRDLSSSVTKSGGEMHGLENRFKAESSIDRKLLLGKEVKDALRYTAILSEDDFVIQYNSVKFLMEQKGYEETRCKNYFEEYRQGKVSHKSVQCNFKTPDGYEYELQFQTKASQKAKDKKVPLYEEARNPNTSETRKKELEKQMRDLADKVPDPPGIEQIQEHK